MTWLRCINSFITVIVFGLVNLPVQEATGTGDWIQHTGKKKPAGASTKVSKKSGAECGAF